ncbi:cytochrome C oxidase subunit IV family protein [Saccharicrinis aurantiacus]|uniref:cytochrome C oxidase subunit IV family protein n=1 Tax=Saccharicrinis aurantiacus TaxID=1849719 RepID=UPI0009501C2D|nr:cytochrome C oxidase subunit IV family protein [Saccharicrinis aurantiacus]
MENHTDAHIVPYKMYLYILGGLIMLTLISVAVTEIEFGEFSVLVALVLASIKATLVLIYFMHLKFDNKILQIMVPAIFILVALVIIIVFLDYNYR